MKWNADRYDADSGFVSRYGEDVLGWLNARPGEKVVDLGCGTGELVQRMTEQGVHVVGLDASSDMTARAHVKYPALDIRQADAHTFELEGQRDAVFSNAALHWMLEPAKVVDRVWLALRPGGRFVGELGAKGNVDTVLQPLTAKLQAAGYAADGRWPWYFPALGEYAALLEARGFRVEAAHCFDRPTPLGEPGLRGWLDTFAVPLFAGVPDEVRGRIFDELERELAGALRTEAGWTADYRRLRFKAWKPA